MGATNSFTAFIKKWGNDHFGNIFREKKLLLARINGIQKSPYLSSSSFLQSLEKDLITNYNNILKLEEDYWKLRSRITWLNEGDANTRFFQISASNRRRKDHISFFKNSEGVWIDNHLDIINNTLDHFSKLFCTSHTLTDMTHLLHSTTNFHTIDLSALDRPLIDEEIYSAIFSFKPFKSPGPDGLHPFFTKNTGR